MTTALRLLGRETFHELVLRVKSMGKEAEGAVAQFGSEPSDVIVIGVG